MVKSTVLYTIASFVPRITGLLIVPLYAKVLTPTEFGIVSSIEALKAILLVFVTLGLERSMNRLYYDYSGSERSQFMGTLFLAVAIVSSVASASFSTVFASFVHELFPSIPFYPYFLLGIITTLFSALGTVPNAYYRLAEKPIWYVSFAVAKTILTILTALLFLTVFKWGVLGVLWSGLLVEALITFTSWVTTFRNFQFRFSWMMTKASLAFSLPMLPSLVSAWITNQSNRVFIDRYLSQADLGVYSFASKITDAGSMFAVAFMAAYTPIYYRLINERGEEEARGSLKKYNSWFLLALLGSIFLVSFFSRELTILLADSRYSQANLIIPTLSLSVLIAQMTGLNNLALYQRKKTFQVMLAIIVAAVTSLLLNWLLIPLFGLLGAVAASLISTLVNYVLTYWQSKRAYFVGFSGKPFLLALIVGSLLVFLALSLSEQNAWILFGIKLCFLVILGTALFALFRKKILSAVSSLR